MKHAPGILSLLVVTAGITCHCAAREADGTLGLIRYPHNGRPVMITPTGTFEAILQEEAHLTLSGAGGTTDLEVAWSPLPGGLKHGLCRATAPLSPGAHALHAKTEGGGDTNIRSVYVLEAFPENYRVAHITDLHIGRDPGADRDSGTVREAIETVNTADAAFVLITGDVTDQGEPAQFASFLELLDRCSAPTYVVVGNHDRKDNHYQAFFGPSTYTFTFGSDGYLAFDTKDFLIADEMDGQNGLLHLYRRQLRASRWSIGFTHRYDVSMGMRAQLSLFVDDPLDYLVYGHYHREPGEGDGIPWGNTRHIMTPAAVDGKMRFLLVDAEGVKALETISSASEPGSP